MGLLSRECAFQPRARGHSAYRDNSPAPVLPAYLLPGKGNDSAFHPEATLPSACRGAPGTTFPAAKRERFEGRRRKSIGKRGGFNAPCPEFPGFSCGKLARGQWNHDAPLFRRARKWAIDRPRNAPVTSGNLRRSVFMKPHHPHDDNKWNGEL